MSDQQNKEWKRALWSVVVAAILAIGANFWMNVQFQATVKEQNRVMEIEIKILRTKIDNLSIHIERKVDRETLDNCLSDIRSNVSDLRTQIDAGFVGQNKFILEFYKSNNR